MRFQPGEAEALAKLRIDARLPAKLELLEACIAGVATCQTVDGIRASCVCLLREFPEQHVGVVVDLPFPTAGVDGSDGRIAQANESPVECVLRSGVYRCLGLLSVLFSVETELLGQRQRDRLVTEGGSGVVSGLARLFEPIGKLSFVVDTELARVSWTPPI